jgi:Family of unknown function (DUF5706)
MALIQNVEMDDVHTKIDIMEKALERLLTWVRAAESRIRLVLPLSTAMLGALALLIPNAYTDWTFLEGVSTAAAVVLLMLGIVCTCFATFPRTTGPPESCIYFRGITTRTLQQYTTDIKAQTEDCYLDDLISQCYRNAQIAERKYLWIKRSMICLFVATPPWLISLFFFYY